MNAAREFVRTLPDVTTCTEVHVRVSGAGRVAAVRVAQGGGGGVFWIVSGWMPGGVVRHAGRGTLTVDGERVALTSLHGHHSLADAGAAFYVLTKVGGA